MNDEGFLKERKIQGTKTNEGSYNDRQIGLDFATHSLSCAIKIDTTKPWWLRNCAQCICYPCCFRLRCRSSSVFYARKV